MYCWRWASLWWIDPVGDVAWAQGTHEYRPLGTAGHCGASDQFRRRDFHPGLRRRPEHLAKAFAGFFGSLEDLNATLRAEPEWKLRWTPGHFALRLQA